MYQLGWRERALNTQQPGFTSFLVIHWPCTSGEITFLRPFFTHTQNGPRRCDKKNAHTHRIFVIIKNILGVPVVAQRKWIWPGTMRMQVRSLASPRGVRIWCCRELLGRSQTRLRSGIAGVEAGSCSSDLTSSLGTSICLRCGPEKKEEKKKNIYIYTHTWSSHCGLAVMNPTRIHSGRRFNLWPRSSG